jgi:hypothetical protein
MRKFLVIVLVIICSSVPSISFLNCTEFESKSLLGINNIIVLCEFNGISYGEGYLVRKEDKITEFNLGETIAKLKEDGFLVSKKDLLEIYHTMESRIKKADIQILKSKRYRRDKSSVIPILTIKVTLIKATPEIYASAFNLVLSKWLANWSGGTRIFAPVAIWSTEKLISMEAQGFIKKIKATIFELSEKFIRDFKKANN